MGVRAKVGRRHPRETEGWDPRVKDGSRLDDGYRGSNVDLGTPDMVVDELREKHVQLDEVLAYSAKLNKKYRKAKTDVINQRAALMSRCPATWKTNPGDGEEPLIVSLKSVSARDQWLEAKMVGLFAEEADCKLQWELMMKAANVLQAQLDGIRSMGARVGDQFKNDGRFER